MTNSRTKTPEDFNVEKEPEVISNEHADISPEEDRFSNQNERMKKVMAAYHSGNPDEKQYAVEQMTNEISGFLGHMINKNFKAFAPEYYWDLYNEGMVAVLTTMSKYNPDMSTPTTYFTFPVIHAMSAFVNSVTNKSSAYYSSIMNKIRGAINYFESIEEKPTVANIALHTGLSIKKVEEGMKRINAVNEYRYETDAELDSVLNEQAKNPEEQILEQEREMLLKNALERLNEIDRKLIMYRFGFDDGTEKSFAKIAKLVNLPVNQVTSSISRSLRILRDSPELSDFQNMEAKKKREDVLNDMHIILAPTDIVSIYAELGEDNEATIKLSFDSENTKENPDTEDNDEFFIKF